MQKLIKSFMLLNKIFGGRKKAIFVGSKTLLVASLILSIVPGVPSLIPQASAQTPVSFIAALNFSAGSNPASVAIGDFNGDTKQDLAVTNLDSNNVSILLGTGTGSFGAAANFSVRTRPTSVAIGDFNGDTKQDLAVANQGSNNVSILLGTGTGSFGADTTFSVGTGPEFVAVGDFNGDTKQDLVVANYSSYIISILLGTGTGSFGAAANFGVGSNPRSVAIGDFNGDTKQDLAVANQTANTISILLGTGTGDFGAAANFLNFDLAPYFLAIGDFNGDAKQDLAVANTTSNAVSILLGTGTGSFDAVAFFRAGTHPYGVAIGDFNGDAKQDLAVANLSSNNVSILINNTVFPPDTTPPPAPILLTPTNGAIITTTQTSLDWSDVADASGVTYTAEVDNNADFLSPEFSQTGLVSSATITTALAIGTYNWRVKATDGVGNIGAFSTVFTFTIGLDTDSDGIPDTTDNCPTISNPTQTNTDGDAFGDACDPDDDNDGIEDRIDTQPLVQSVAFTDGPVANDGRQSQTSGGTTFGNENRIADAKVEELANPTGIRATALVNSARLFTCSTNTRTTLRNIGDTVDITCGSTTAIAGTGNLGNVELVDSFKKPGIRVSLPAGQEATITDPTVITPARNTAPVVTDVIDDLEARLYSWSQPGGSETTITQNPDGSTVLLAIEGSATVLEADGTTTSVSSGSGVIVTPTGIAGTSSTDIDNDGVTNNNDECVFVAGTAANLGCPGRIDFLSQEKTANSANVAELPPGRATSPVVEGQRGVTEVGAKLYKKAELLALLGNPSRIPLDQLCTIFDNAVNDGALVDGVKKTDSTGHYSFGAPSTTIEYALIESVRETIATKNMRACVLEEILPRHFDANSVEFREVNKIVVTTRETASGQILVKKTAGHTSTIEGSLLTITSPQYVEWSGTEELYPFFFESADTWTVDVCAQVPTGYQIVGVQDDLGNLLTTSSCVQTFVTGEMKVILFKVAKVGSPPVFALEARLRAKGPSGKVSTLDLSVPSKVLEKARGVPFQSAVKRLFGGASLWSAIKNLLGLGTPDVEVLRAAKSVAQANLILVPEWGLNEGRYDSRRLPWGFELKLDSVSDLIVR